MPRSKFAKYTCDICQKTLRRKQTFEAHMKSHLPPDEKQFKCDRCDKSFGSQAWLTRHGKIHSGEGQGKLGIIGNRQEVAHLSRVCQNQNQLEMSWYGTGVADPFIIFPREIWCMILENVAYFSDLQNIFEVYPELEVLHRRKRQLYFFDQVISHIAEWMGERDLLNCRRVSRQWSMAVDSFLENNPSVRAYDQQASSGSMWDPLSYSKCFHGQSFVTPHSEHILYRKYFAASYIFDYSDDFTNFLYKTKEYPLEFNPFVGRSVTFDLECDFSSKTMLNIFWQRAFNFLSKWGKHIWFLKIVQGEHQSDIQLSREIRRSLHLLPNLRSLHLHGNGKQITCSQVTDGLLELPHLETLQTSNISYANPLVTQMLLPQYSDQIRRVQMELENSDLGRAARNKFSSMSLPNLTELHITDIHIGRGAKWKNGVDNILMSLDAPQLCTIGLRIAATLLSLEERANVKDSELFGWLLRFPRLKQLHFPHHALELEISSASSPPIFQSIESLCINIETLERCPGILTFFPSIQCLLLCAELAAENRSRSEEEDFRACNNEVHLERYWDVLGNLQKLNVIVLMCGAGWNGPRYRFLKGDIEKYLRKSGAIAK